jgi:hypothetical protein
MKYILTLFLIIILILSVSAQETPLPNWITTKVYIDPNFTGTESGTFANPYKSTKSAGFSWSKKHAYLFKRNTVLTVSASETISADSIIIGAYGAGDRPVLNYSVLSRALMVWGTGSSVKDIELIVPPVDEATGIDMRGAYGTIDNCVIIGGNKGITASGCVHLKVLNTDVSGGIYDAMYISNLDTFSVFNCYMHDMVLMPDRINQTSIDNIHTEATSIVLVDSLFSDHSNFPGKYCLIINGADSVSVKNSTFIGHPGNGVVYPGTCAKGWTIQNCYFEGGLWGIQNNTTLRIYNSVFRGQIDNAIYEGGDKWIYNCTFVDQKYAIRTWNGIIKELKNCIFYNFTGTFQTNNSLIETFTNNCFYPVTGQTNFFKGSNYIEQDPLFFDYENGNYRLSSGSPCINVGTNVPLSTVDITGVPRPQGAKIDYGAYEYIDGLPSVFNVSTDGSGCEKDSASVFLSGSELGVDFILCKNDVRLKHSFEGTGSSIDFGKQNQPGIYTVQATKHGTYLTNKMKGNPAVMKNPLPTDYYIIGGGYYDESLGGARVTLSQSDTGIFYQLYNNNLAIGTQLDGTGDSLAFGIQSIVGIYTVIATNPVTGCSGKMPNFVLISYIDGVSHPQNVPFGVSPNPSHGNFTITLVQPSESIGQINIYNLSGELISKTIFEKGQQEIPFSLSGIPGNYILQVIGAGINYKPTKISIQ